MGNQLCGDRNDDPHNFISNVQTPGPANRRTDDGVVYNEKHEESANKIAKSWRENKAKAKEKEDQLNRVKVLDKNFSQIGKYITQQDANAKLSTSINDLDKKLGTFQGLPVDKAQISLNLIYKRPFQYDSDGSIYHGFWNLNGLREGYGYLIRCDGTKLEGLWKNGEIFKGRIIERDGSYYEGKIKSAEANGEGIYVDKNGISIYRGFFLNNNYNGFGMKLFEDKANFSGNFENNHMTGKGKFNWADKTSYEGDFINSVINGSGIFRNVDGHKYNGQWKDNKPEGEGRYDFNSLGSIHYKGHFHKGRKEGDGTFIDEERKIKYDGKWSCDKPHGEGTFTSKELTITACWRYGQLVKVVTVTKGETPKNLKIEIPEQSFRNLAEKGHLDGYSTYPNKNSPSKNYRIVNNEKEVMDSLFKNISNSKA